MTKKVKNKLTSRELFICVSGLLIYFLFVHTLDKTLNYPYEILYYPSIAVSLISFLISLKALRTEIMVFKTFLEKGFAVCLKILTITLLSLYTISVLLIPFNYYNIHYAKKNDTEIYNCEITGLTDYSKNHCIYYIFKNKTNIIYAHMPLMDEIYSNKKFDQYVFVATVKPGLLGTSILQTWELKHK